MRAVIVNAGNRTSDELDVYSGSQKLATLQQGEQFNVPVSHSGDQVGIILIARHKDSDQWAGDVSVKVKTDDLGTDGTLLQGDL